MNEIMDKLPIIANAIGAENAYFPYSHNNGICEKLILDTTRCSIYENRPVICNLEKLIFVIAEKAKVDLSLVRKAMYNETEKNCKKLQTE
jgi:Fe-S-cluster containining protein